MMITMMAVIINDDNNYNGCDDNDGCDNDGDDYNGCDDNDVCNDDNTLPIIPLFLFQVSDALPPVPRKRDILMLESPSKPLPISFVGPHSRPLPPISAPTGERTNHVLSPRQTNTAPSKTRTKSRNRSRSVPPVPLDEPRPEKEQEEETRTTAQTTSNVDTASTREQQQARTDDTDEGFFLTQV